MKEEIKSEKLVQEIEKLRVQIKELETDEFNKRQELDDKVVRRSVELAKVNVELRDEIIDHKKTQQEMAALTKKIEFVLGATKTGLDIIDSDFNMVYIDPQWMKVYGDYIGKKCYEYFMDRSEICPNCGVAKAIVTKKPVVTEEALEKEGGRPVSVTSIPFQDEKGNWLVAEVNVDISERKKQEKQYEAIIKASIDGFWLADMQGNILDVNDSYCNIVGYNRQELLKMKIPDLEVDEDPVDVQAHIRKVKKDGGDRFETRHKHKDGSIVNVEISVTYLDSLNQMFVFVRDITERKHSEEELKGSEERFKLLYQSSRDAIMQLYPDKGFFGGNVATIKMFRCKDEAEFVSKGPADLSPKRQADGALSTIKAQEMMKIAMEKGSHFFEWIHQRTDKKTFPATVLLTRMKLKGDYFLQATVRDISESKKVEMALMESELTLRNKNIILEQEVLALKKMLGRLNKTRPRHKDRQNRSSKDILSKRTLRSNK